ncbi:hypothetical protein RchiOBHm_Chr4g0436121 [Rosa chinensis]|uniref:Uncharacterized protein n=1 Tax=Rosa chinensis TaxID=74649 RepID=A0A2P6R244_ROSCH|nr:hypothetical protein RchiOBHm_Chr4g0436121 [Rosa chinensis]
MLLLQKRLLYGMVYTLLFFINIIIFQLKVIPSCLLTVFKEDALFHGGFSF